MGHVSKLHKFVHDITELEISKNVKTTNSICKLKALHFNVFINFDHIKRLNLVCNQLSHNTSKQGQVDL